MHVGMGNVVMHVWHVHECVDACRYATSVQVRQVIIMMQCSAQRRACACIHAIDNAHNMQRSARLNSKPYVMYTCQ